MPKYDYTNSSYFLGIDMYSHHDNRRVCAENKAIELRNLFLGLSGSVVRKIESYYRNNSGNLPEECLSTLIDILPSYFGTYKASIDFINTHSTLLFIQEGLIKPKLACLHMLGLDKDALENCVSLITKSKIRNLFSVCCALNLADDNDNRNKLDSKCVLTLMNRLSLDGKMDEYNKLFCSNGVLFNSMQVEYEKFLNYNADHKQLSVKFTNIK